MNLGGISHFVQLFNQSSGHVITHYPLNTLNNTFRCMYASEKNKENATIIKAKTAEGRRKQAGAVGNLF